MASDTAERTCRAAAKFLLAVPQSDDYAAEARELSEAAAGLLSEIRRQDGSESPSPAGQVEWVSVEERLPERSHYVLICLTDNDGRRLTAEAQWFVGHWVAHQFGPVPAWRVTHWCEKPAPPQAPTDGGTNG